LRNTGNAHAKDVSVSFSKEDVKVKGLREIPKLKVGEVLLEVMLSFEDFDEKKYFQKEEIWIEVSDKVSKKETPVGNFTRQLLIHYSSPSLIGSGGFAYVFRAKRKKDGLEVAVKVPRNREDLTTGKILNTRTSSSFLISTSCLSHSLKWNSATRTLMK
jgi:serine/threonine protein kinase